MEGKQDGEEKELIMDYIKAGFPVLWMRTNEPERFIGSVVESMKDKRSVYVWDVVRGFKLVGETGYVQDDSSDPYNIIQTITKANDKSVWLLNNFHFWIKEPIVIQSILNNLGVFKTKGVTVCVVSPQFSLPIELDREVVLLDYDLPNRDDLSTILSDLEESTNIFSETRELVLDAAQGLTWSEAENALALALVKTKTFDPRVVGELKAQMVQKNADLVFGRHTETFATLGGYEHAKNWTLNRFKSWRPGLPRRGVMFLGVPGCGKSHFGKAFANEIGWDLIEYSMEKSFGSLVGESESRIRAALDTVTAMRPCILLLDEVDKSLAGVGGSTTDGGTTQRVGGIFLKWMQDRPDDIFVIGTANDISKLPTEYKRTGGRWDAIFFVDLPNTQERESILRIYLNQFMGSEFTFKLSESEFSKMAIRLEGFTGAEIKQVTIEMAYGSTFDEAIKFVIPISKSQADDIKRLRDQAKAWQNASRSEVETAKKGVRRVTLDG